MAGSRLKVNTAIVDVQKPELWYRIWCYIKKDYILHLMILPGLIGVLLFKYGPMYGMILAFKRYDIVAGFFASPWIGFDNFKQFFNDPYCFRLIRNTLLLGSYTILWGFPIPIIFALMLNEVKYSFLKRVTQTISYLPHFMPLVVLVGIIYQFFGSYGIINESLKFFGLTGQNFLGASNWFRTLYIGSGLWQQIGWNSIIYLATLSAIDPGLYEAAIIDGANRWKQMLHVTLPGIASTVAILFILNIGTVLNVGFEKVFLMYNPGVYETADVLSTYVYRRGIQSMDFGFGTAIDLFNGVITLIIVLITNYTVKRMGEDSLL